VLTHFTVWNFLHFVSLCCLYSHHHKNKIRNTCLAPLIMCLTFLVLFLCILLYYLATIMFVNINQYTFPLVSSVYTLSMGEGQVCGSHPAVWDSIHFPLHLLLEQTLLQIINKICFCIVIPIRHIGSIYFCLYVSLYSWVFIHSVLPLLLVLYKTIYICIMSSVIPIICGRGSISLYQWFSLCCVRFCSFCVVGPNTIANN